jgi:hypothetical protein
VNYRKDAWPDEHDAAMRQCLADGMTFKETAAFLTAQFGRLYTRSAIGGRCNRVRVKSLNPPACRLGTKQERTLAREQASQARLKPTQPLIQPRVIPMRCDDPEAMNVPLVELRDSHCRWPVSGERAATLFCGRLRLEASSYCPRHHAASVGPGTATEKAAHRVTGLV